MQNSTIRVPNFYRKGINCWFCPLLWRVLGLVFALPLWLHDVRTQSGQFLSLAYLCFLHSRCGTSNWGMYKHHMCCVSVILIACINQDINFRLVECKHHFIQNVVGYAFHPKGAAVENFKKEWQTIGKENQVMSIGNKPIFFMYNSEWLMKYSRKESSLVTDVQYCLMIWGRGVGQHNLESGATEHSVIKFTESRANKSQTRWCYMKGKND